MSKNKLNLKQTRFCEIYAYGTNRGNGVMSYAEAYNIDLSNPGAYGSARSGAHRLLTNDDILSYIRSLYENDTLNNITVDNELAFLVKQSADFGSKLGAIKEYNKLNSRITDKIETKHSFDRELIIKGTDE